MTNLIILAVLSCPATQILVQKGLTWDAEVDQPLVLKATARCAELYGPEIGCLVKFFKTGDRQYQVICGAKR